MSSDNQQEIAYTLEFKTKQKAHKRSVKKIILTIGLIIIIAAAACALAFGVGIAKDII